ncbi:hypothetical protein LXL04_014057 [Taraxacum kok-saghyz]
MSPLEPLKLFQTAHVRGVSFKPNPPLSIVSSSHCSFNDIYPLRLVEVDCKPARRVIYREVTGDSDQMWTSSERFYPNVNKFGTFLPKCGQDGSGYSKPLPLLFLVVDGNIAGDAPPPLILRLFLSLRLREFEREIGGGSRAFLFSWAVHQNIYRYRVNDIQSRLNHPKTLSPARARDPGDVPNHYRKKKR